MFDWNNSGLAEKLEKLEARVKELEENNKEPTRNLCKEEVVKIVKQARKDAFVRNGPNWEDEFNFLPPKNGLSTSCAEFILQNLDPNKRIQLSMTYPGIRGIEKSLSLEIGILFIYPSKVIVNNTKYVFGEILQIPENSLLDEEEISKINEENSTGGLGWRSLKDDVIEPGDVELGNYDISFLKNQKNEIMEDFRCIFMRELEMYLNGKEKLNPIEILNKFEEESVREAFDRQARNMFEILGGPSESLGKIYSMRDFFNQVKNGRSGQEDRLAQEYPKSFEFMKNIVENSRTGRDILKKLLYPQKSIPTFNQFTILKNDEAKYTVHLPEHVNLRRAFKIFTSIIFGGRREIKVKYFEIGGRGIVGLPVGFKIRAEDLMFLIKSNLNAYAKTISYADSLSVNDSNISDLITLDIVKSCRHLFYYSGGNNVEEKILENLNNDNIYFDICNIVPSIENWLKNSNRKIGSKLFMELHFKDSLKKISEGLISRGFVSCDVEEERLQSRFQYGDKQISVTKTSLTKKNDIGNVPDIFHVMFDRRTVLIVEVVNT